MNPITIWYNLAISCFQHLWTINQRYKIDPSKSYTDQIIMPCFKVPRIFSPVRSTSCQSPWFACPSEQLMHHSEMPWDTANHQPKWPKWHDPKKQCPVDPNGRFCGISPLEVGDFTSLGRFRQADGCRKGDQCEHCHYCTAAETRKKLNRSLADMSCAPGIWCYNMLQPPGAISWFMDVHGKPPLMYNWSNISIGSNICTEACDDGTPSSLAPAHCNTMVETRTTSSPTTTSSIPFCHLWETCLPCALQSGESKPPFPHTHTDIYIHTLLYTQYMYPISWYSMASHETTIFPWTDPLIRNAPTTKVFNPTWRFVRMFIANTVVCVVASRKPYPLNWIYSHCCWYIRFVVLLLPTSFFQI